MQDNTTYAARLTDRRILRISGADANDFLNGLVTADVALLADGGSCHGGLLTPQGKILFEFFIARDGDSYFVDVAEAVHGELAKRLGFYKLRSAVDIEITDELQVAAFWGGKKLPGRADPRLAAMGHRLVATRADIDAATDGLAPGTVDDFDKHRIALGVPEGIKDYPLGNTFPHEACFDQLNGVSFSKGCYVGQEVVSRMRHRGTARKRTIQIFAGKNLPEPGTPVLADERAIGTVGSSSGSSGIAMIRLDRVAKANTAGIVITAGDLPLDLKCQDWADFKIDEPQTENSNT